MKILSKKELQQITVNHSSDIEFKYLMKIYKKCTAESYSLLNNNTTSPSSRSFYLILPIK